MIKHNDEDNHGRWSPLEDSNYEIDSARKRTLNRHHQYLLQEEQPLSILVVTWNLMGTVPSLDNLERLLTSDRLKHDLLVIGTQQCERSLLLSFFCEAKTAWQALLHSLLELHYVKISSNTLQGLHIVAYIKHSLTSYVSEIDQSKLKRGYCGIMGNKGAVGTYYDESGLSFNIGAKRLLFVNVHLNASKTSCEKRNKDLLAIVQKVIQKETYEQVFFFGDLNYRLVLSKQQAITVGTQKKYLSLIRYDSLRRQEKLVHFLHEYTEGILNFAPTYKVHPNINKFDESRIPGWTDRIFFKSENEEVELIKYSSKIQALGSDHRPVYASFLTKFNRQREGYVKLRQPESKCSLI